LAASGDGSISLWDVQERTKISTFVGHDRSVRCLSVCPDEPNLVASGGRDGSVMVWDVRLPKENEDGVGPVRTVRNAHVDRPPKIKTPKRLSKTSLKSSVGNTSPTGPPPITAVLLHDKHSVISGANKMSGIRFWDLRKIYSTKSSLPPVPSRELSTMDGPREFAGFTSFSTHPFGRHTLYASCTDNVIYAYSLTSSSSVPVRMYRGAQIASFDINTAICPVSPYLLCGSRNGGALIWSVDSHQPSFVLDGHLEEIYAVAWNDRFEILTFSSDCWRVWKTDECYNTRDHPNHSAARCQAFDVELCERTPKKRRTA